MSESWITAPHSTASPLDEASVQIKSRAPEESFFDHYFRRIEPSVAESFTEEQRRAILTMFGARGVARHAVDLRFTLPLGWRRLYFVFLVGRDRRQRLRRPGLNDLARQSLWAVGLLAVSYAIAASLRL